MFGWELPPHNSGGLGTACLGLTQGLAPLGVDIDFVLPGNFSAEDADHMNVIDASLYPASKSVLRRLRLAGLSPQQVARSLGYGSEITIGADGLPRVTYLPSGISAAPEAQARWYAYQAASIAKEREFDLIHSHEWMTYYSGIAAREVAHARGEETPLVTHVHATEIDRGGADGGNQAIIQIEKEGLQRADRVVTVSHYTKKIVEKHYGVPARKISVVHNGISTPANQPKFDLHALKKHYKLVLFMGRITMSKGPDYFIKLAKAVTDQDAKVKFIMVGSGDMEKRCIELAAQQGLTGKVLFSPFLRGEDVNRAYQLADLFIMPSVSEPFGLVALEAMQNGTPAIVSKQSGVAEVSDNLVKIDFWDTEEMRKAVLELLYSPHKSQALTQAGLSEMKHLSWENSAQRVQGIYQELLGAIKPPVLQPAFIQI